MNPVILFEPDGYLTEGKEFLGRRAAGAGFLRAHVEGRRAGPLAAYTPFRSSMDVFARSIAAIDPEAQGHWISQVTLAQAADYGVFYRPDHNVGQSAWQRLRVGADRYALCGVTHTLATTGSMQLIAELMTAPVMPWDAVICTTHVAVKLVQDGLAEQADYLAWRFGQRVAAPPPMLPVIPLGVHCDDFEFSEAERVAARASVGLADDEVAALFAGRLTFSGKANPFQMYTAMQRVAERTGRKLVMVHAGQFPNEAVGKSFHDSVARLCPSVRCVFVDGKHAERFHLTWAASDIFISLSDSVQETFGITPVEAMAAGLPVLATDWNGYKETVRDGVDGFRIPTWQPGPGYGPDMMRDYENGAIRYDVYLSRTSTTVSAEMQPLTERLTELVEDAGLRRRMGAAGKARARELFDWPVVYRQYQALWGEQRAMLKSARVVGAPAAGPHAREPFAAFDHYPTHRIGPETRAKLRDGVDAETYIAVTSTPIIAMWAMKPEGARRVFPVLARGEASMAELAAAFGISHIDMAQLLGRLAKMELVELKNPA